MAPTSSSKSTSKIGRNDPCECNSGKKAKACCGEKRVGSSFLLLAKIYPRTFMIAANRVIARLRSLRPHCRPQLRTWNCYILRKLQSMDTKKVEKRKLEVRQTLNILCAQRHKVDQILPELAVDLFRGIEKKIQVHTCKSEECATKWKAFVQINMPGGTPLVMFPPKGEQKSRIESLEKLVEKLGEAVEKKEMDELRSAMEARDQASEG